jgi:hypothetical protein
MSVLLAGGGITGGQVYGASDEKGEFVADRPVKVEDLAATIYHAQGIDPGVELRAPNGRPIRLANHGSPVRDLFG